MKAYDPETGAPTGVVAGHHLNRAAYSELASRFPGKMHGCGWNGIFPLFGRMRFPAKTASPPAGRARIYPAEADGRRVRV